MDKDAKIYVAGHRGLVGAAIVRRLLSEGFTNIIMRTSQELDLANQSKVADFFAWAKPDYVFLAAAKVGGIHANATYPAEFIYQNLAIQTNVIHQSYLHGVKKLLFLGSSCIYPRECPQPIREEYLMTGPLEPTNEPYAMAKIAGIELCWAYNAQYGTSFIPVMPTNLYGPDDNFDLENSHVLPALLRKFYLAKEAAAGNHDAISKDEARFGRIPENLKKDLVSDGSTSGNVHQLSQPPVVIWGTGTPRREFLHVDDMADACLFIMLQPADSRSVLLPPHPSPLINIGTGTDCTIKELAKLIKDVVGFTGELAWDETKPDGAPQKLLDVSRLQRLGWQAKIGLQQGIQQVYQWYRKQER